MSTLDAMNRSPWPGTDAFVLACSASAWRGAENRCRWCNAVCLHHHLERHAELRDGGVQLAIGDAA